MTSPHCSGKTLTQTRIESIGTMTKPQIKLIKKSPSSKPHFFLGMNSKRIRLALWDSGSDWIVAPLNMVDDLGLTDEDLVDSRFLYTGSGEPLWAFVYRVDLTITTVGGPAIHLLNKKVAFIANFNHVIFGHKDGIDCFPVHKFDNRNNLLTVEELIP